MSNRSPVPAMLAASFALGLLLASRAPMTIGVTPNEAPIAAIPAPAASATPASSPAPSSAARTPAPRQASSPATVTAATSPVAFAPPPDTAIPDTPLGKMIKLGEDIFRHTGQAAPQFVGNQLACSNCHIDGGRLANAAPLWAAWVAFPAYRAKNGHVNTFEERMQGCFRFSMNGKAPPLGDKTLVALESYSAWLARGAPFGASLPGRGYPAVPKPAQPADYGRGEHVYQEHCALCHGGDGAGQSAAGQVVFPALWGPESYNWGAGMGSLTNAAGFIKANMPLGLGGSLSDQDAWDVAMFVDSQERPQDPRFVGSVQETRAKFHDSPSSIYGQTVDGRLVGIGTGH